MEKEIKREARKQYFHYFRLWFIGIGILAVIVAVAMVFHYREINRPRGNNRAPGERVYDYADVLTDREEQQLREYIASQEKLYHFDIVLVTVNQDVESQGDWDGVMCNLADDIYENGNYGYDKVHGDGALLLDNWYEDERGSQKGSWLSTCGSVYEEFGNYEINKVLRAVYDKVDENPYEAYREYVRMTCSLMGDRSTVSSLPLSFILLFPLVVAVIYAVVNLRQSPAKDTTTATVYMAGGKPMMRATRDDFIRKSVVTRRINTDSGSRSSGGGHSGGGGGHVSSGGVSHGGGGMRR